jgi:dihydrofolate reductase
MKPRISIIVACAHHGVIGRNNELPWHLPEDLAHFKQTTLGKPVIMGRKTFDSIVARLGKPLPGRRNIVITRNREWHYTGVEVAHDLESAVALCKLEPDIFIIGGAELYQQAMPLADRLIVTEIALETEGDAHFPPIDVQVWQETGRDEFEHAPLPYAFVTYERRT